jgi:hypothetical protein
MKPLRFPAFSFFLLAGALLQLPPDAKAQTDLPLPKLRTPEPGGPLSLQRPAPPAAPGIRLEPLSEPAPLPLPPDPSPFPSFPPAADHFGPVEIDLRKRASTSLVPDGPNPTEDAALQLRDRVRYRELKARATARPEVRSSLDAVQKARSDRELREAWRQHYHLLFSAMRSLDKTLEPLIAQREKESLGPLLEKLPRPAGGR